MTENTQNSQNEASDPFIESIEQFENLITDWYSSKVKLLMHIQTVPLDTEVQIGEDSFLTLNAENHNAFVLGIELALGILGTLPFTSYEIPEDPIQ